MGSKDEASPQSSPDIPLMLGYQTRSQPRKGSETSSPHPQAHQTAQPQPQGGMPTTSNAATQPANSLEGMTVSEAEKAIVVKKQREVEEMGVRISYLLLFSLHH